MNRTDVLWVFLRAFAIYLLVEALFRIPFMVTHFVFYLEDIKHSSQVPDVAQGRHLKAVFTQGFDLFCHVLAGWYLWTRTDTLSKGDSR